MENSEIKYKLSTDYIRLQELLKNGNVIVGLVAISDTKGKPLEKYSKVASMFYYHRFESYTIGNLSFFECDLGTTSFSDICKKENVRYFDISTPQTQSNDFEKYEDELLQIIRFHANDIEINVEFTPGDIRYHAQMKVIDTKYTSVGVNLWKRYKCFVDILTGLYGENLHKYGTKPLNK